MMRIDCLKENGDIDVCVRVEGELDVASVDELRCRLRELVDADQDIRLDLSRLDFIDVRGARAVYEAATQSRREGLHFEIEPDLRRPVRRMFALAQMEHLLYL